MNCQFFLTNITENNFAVLCRTCLIKNDELQSIFTNCEKFVKNYAEMIMAVAPVKITEKDIFPLKVCNPCILKIQHAYEFQQKCLEIQDFLISHFEIIEEKIKLEQIKDRNDLSNRNNDLCNNENDKFTEDDKDDVLKEITDEIENDGALDNVDNYFCEVDDRENENVNEHDDNDTVKYYENDTKIKKRRKLKKEDKRTIEKKHQCTLCPMNFISKYKLTCHMLVHTKEKPFICDICGNKFTSNGNLKRHVKAHRGERDFACDFVNCGKRFCQKVTLIEHRRIHTGEKPFKCPLCEKSFKTSSCLRQHRLGAAHGNVRPTNTVANNSADKKPEERHECTECDKTYATKNGLYQHSLRHSNKKLICSFCNKEFVSYAGLQQHKHAQHSDDHKFQCNQCGKIFKYQVVFKTHMLIHSGIKPYKCQYCTKRFTQKGHVVSHERLHTGIKPYQCEFCHKVFRHLTTLRDHRRIHTGEVPYKCTICNRGFYNSTTLKKHLIGHK